MSVDASKGPLKGLITPPVNKVMYFERMGRGCLGFGRNLVGILPTSLPELPVQLRDLRNNQKFSNTNFVVFTFPCFCYRLSYFAMPSDVFSSWGPCQHHKYDLHRAASTDRQTGQDTAGHGTLPGNRHLLLLKGSQNKISEYNGNTLIVNRKSWLLKISGCFQGPLATEEAPAGL